MTTFVSRAEAFHSTLKSAFYASISPMELHIPGQLTELVELVIRAIGARKALRAKIMMDIDAKYEQLRDTTNFLFSSHRQIQKLTESLTAAREGGKNDLTDEVNGLKAAIGEIFDSRASRRATLLALREEVGLLAERFENPADEIFKPLNSTQVAAVKHFMTTCVFFFEASDDGLSMVEHVMYNRLGEMKSQIDHVVRGNSSGLKLDFGRLEVLERHVASIESEISTKWNLVAGAYTYVRLTIQ